MMLLPTAIMQIIAKAKSRVYSNTDLMQSSHIRAMFIQVLMHPKKLNQILYILDVEYRIDIYCYLKCKKVLRRPMGLGESCHAEDRQVARDTVNI